MLPALLSILGATLAYLFQECYSLILAHGKINPRISLDHFYRIFVPTLGFCRLFTLISPFFYFAGYFNSIYNYGYGVVYMFSYNYSAKLIDKGYLELLGPFGLYVLFRRLSLMALRSPSSLFFNVF